MRLFSAYLVCTFLLCALADRVHAESPEPGAREPISAEIHALIQKAIITRDRAEKAISSAVGRGEHKFTAVDGKMNELRREQATFHMARSGPLQIFQFRYAEDAGYEKPDVYARDVVTDGSVIYESRYCQRIRPFGVEGRKSPLLEPGSLQPTVWISGNLARYYSFIHLLLEDDELKLSLREERKLRIISARHKDGAAVQEFWIDPLKDCHIVQYRLIHTQGEKPMVAVDVRREWEMRNQLWYVKRCVVRHTFRKEFQVRRVEEIELTFTDYKPNAEVPRDIFSVHALGLMEGARILPRSGPDRTIERYKRDPAFDLSQVERIVGKLPTRLPPK